jgi:hypothetical protein
MHGFRASAEAAHFRVVAPADGCRPVLVRGIANADRPPNPPL